MRLNYFCVLDKVVFLMRVKVSDGGNNKGRKVVVVIKFLVSGWFLVVVVYSRFVKVKLFNKEWAF